MEFWRSLAGLLQVEITSADPPAALSMLQDMGIAVYDAEFMGQLCLRFFISRWDRKRVQSAMEKRGDSFRIVGRKGLFYRLAPLRKRPVLVLGMLILTIFFLWVPSRVFFVQVEGNNSVPSLQIIQSAAECGINFGASRRAVRSEQMKNALLEAMPQLQWAGVNTYGCTAVITVKERNKPLTPQPDGSLSSIVALRDGIIGEITVTRGRALCMPGQAVKQGQILISGYTDLGLSIQATQAEGEVYAQTRRYLTVYAPSNCQFRGEETASVKNYSLIIGKKRINFNNSSGILDTTCAKIYEEKYVTLPGGFVLPIAFVTEYWICYDSQPSLWQAADENLQKFPADYLRQQMLSGRIDHSAHFVTALEGYNRLDGSYICYEMIGVSRTEEN